ncbi:cell division protein ZipA C-terminal FtsZ-binding domain-containing protein [Candidatus Ferrigenium straubiae]|jgi:FtsZ-interacting cell division protein ZipA|uniref:cell division protein ZipA C-terminal FtsZ-binding domain-containing protein n=1 Tax=Candidatus Ferrigenium straubiae TaxID=2919506 RepID=UPI003F4AC8E1
MSELQAALLAIGAGVIVAVYVFGWWQQRKYRRKFGAAFKASHADALYQESAARPVEHILEPLAGEAPVDVAEEAAPAAEIPAATLLDGSCALLEVRSDFIIELHLAEPGPATVLHGLWQRKFDFGKPVQVCGLTLTSRWERAIAESQTLYSRFRIALQLADRGGAISAAKLADFRDLVLGVAKQIKADTAVPDVDETHHRAVELDVFCADVDQMVGINLVPPGERMLPGARIAQAAALHGMTLEADGAFHLLDAQGHSAFSLTSQDSKQFQHHMLETFATPGLTLLLDVPRVRNPTVQFDEMVRVAHELARELQANLVDDHRVVLSDNGLARIRAQIAAVEAKMVENGIAPGSGQARRLFT